MVKEFNWKFLQIAQSLGESKPTSCGIASPYWVTSTEESKECVSETP